MTNLTLYPVIAKEYNDEDGHYFVITSPNVQGMVVENTTLEEAIKDASEDIAGWFEAKGKIEKVQNPYTWNLEAGDKIIYVPVNLSNYYKKYGKMVRKSITVPEYLANWAKDNKINVSRVAADALKGLQEKQEMQA
jgi:predicted RNase H-like HicB family nuclease